MKSPRLPRVILDAVAHEVGLESDVEQRIRMRDQIRAAVVEWAIEFDTAQSVDRALLLRRKTMS